MAHRVAGCIEALELDRFSHLYDVPGADALIDVVNAVARISMSEQCGPGCLDQSLVAARMVAMFMGVKNLGNRPAVLARDIETLRVVEGIDGQGLTGLRARDEVIEVAIGVACPDLLHDHGCCSSRSKVLPPATQVSSTTISSIWSAGMLK